MRGLPDARGLLVDATPMIWLGHNTRMEAKSSGLGTRKPCPNPGFAVFGEDDHGQVSEVSDSQFLPLKNENNDNNSTSLGQLT